MLTGALASSYYGRPRTTLDIDVVMSIPSEDLHELAKALTRAKLKVHEEKLLAAWQSGYPITTLEDRKSPHTLDIIFTNQKLEMRPGHILGLATYYQSAESLILTKLRMIKATLQPERAATDRQDIKAILEAEPIDLKSLRKKAKADSTIKILDDLNPQR
jgi:hypothetical protein